jgi:hypothetical protein
MVCDKPDEYIEVVLKTIVSRSASLPNKGRLANSIEEKDRKGEALLRGVRESRSNRQNMRQSN